MKFTYYGHAAFSLEIGGKHLVFDPFISPNDLAKSIDINTIKADYILVSHGHGDHIADVAAIAKNTGATVIGGIEVINWLSAKGVENAMGINFGSIELDFGRLSFVPAAHSSSLPDGSYGGNPGGFVIASTNSNFYYSGDTSLSAEMQMIPYYADINFAVLPIGGYFTMDAKDAVKAADLIQCKTVIGVHYDTFPPIKLDKDHAKSLFAMADKELLLPEIGESIEF